MRAGRLRTRLKLQSKSTSVSRGTGGSRSTDWQTDATLYAAIDNTAVGSTFDAQQDNPTMQRTWRVRHRGGVSAGKRFVEEASTDNVWKITSPPFDPTGKREELLVETRRLGI